MLYEMETIKKGQWLNILSRDTYVAEWWIEIKKEYHASKRNGIHQEGNFSLIIPQNPSCVNKNITGGSFVWKEF